MAVALRTQPHGRGHRGLPVGPDGPGPPAEPPARLGRRRPDRPLRRPRLLPPDGKHDRRRGVIATGLQGYGATGLQDYRTTGLQTQGVKGVRDYTKIEAWKRADDLTVAIYERTQNFPKEEVYGLTAQLRRAAYSVPANIAEGSARESERDYLHFLYIARGSLTEVQYFVHLAYRLGYLPNSDYQALMEQTKATFACLHGLIKAIERQCRK